jgi:hypothetical protein
MYGDMEAVMRVPGARRWSYTLALAAVSMLGMAILARLGVEFLADHGVGVDLDVAWQVQLARVDAALARNDLAGAEILWAEAYVAAIKSRHWEGMVAAGDIYRRLGGLGGFRKLADAKAREAYLAALFRARNRGSLQGVLRAAQAFAELGDPEVVEQCIRVARSVAARSWNPRAEERVRTFVERWDARAREADHLGLMP